MEIVRCEVNFVNEAEGATEMSDARTGVDVVLPVIKNCIIFEGHVIFSPVCEFEE